MKTIAVKFILLSTFALILFPTMGRAQSISIGSVSATSFCGGDPISVTFSASGNWSQNKNNAFTIQLSDINGSFATFTYLGSIKDTADGTFTISSTIPTDITGSTHYRIRITGAYPYIPSADNGQDITIGKKPPVDLEIADFTTYVTTSVGALYLPVGAEVDSSVQILLPHVDDTSGNATANYDWDFGSGATPPNASGVGLVEKYVTYSTAGDKAVNVTATDPAGCTTSAKIRYHIFDCSNPSILKYAAIDSVQHQDFGSLDNGKNIWVNPGVTLNYGGNGDTIFCESTSQVINGGIFSVFYLKPGASYTETGDGAYNTIIYADGVSLNLSNPPYRKLIHCPNLDFDYTNAPPNKAFPQNGVVNGDDISKAITISPNPTNGNITINGLPQNITDISVMNLLGAMEMKIAKPNSSDLQIDLGKLSPGIYYVRFAMQGAVVTKKIIKE